MSHLPKITIILALIAGNCFTNNICFAQQNEKIRNYKGNKIEYTRPYTPSMWKEINSKTRKEETKFRALDNAPVKLNGQKIYCSMNDKGVAKPKIKTRDISLADYLIRVTKPELEKLPDGEYNLIVSNVIIDASGKIVYYENSGFYKIGADADEKKTKKAPVMNKIAALLNSDTLRFQPATVAGKPVNYLISNTIGYRNNDEITVTNHKLKWHSLEEQ